MLGRLGQPLDGRHGGARDEPSEQGRQGDAADVQQHQDQAQARECAVHVGERLGQLHGVAGREGLGEHAQVDAVRARVAEERFPALCGKLARRGADGQLYVGGRVEPDPAARVDHLLVAAYLVRAGRYPGKGTAAVAQSRGQSGQMFEACDQRLSAPAQLAVHLAV